PVPAPRAGAFAPPPPLPLRPPPRATPPPPESTPSLRPPRRARAGTRTSDAHPGQRPGGTATAPGPHPAPRPLRASPPHPHRARPHRSGEDLLLLRGPQGPHRRGRVVRARVHPGPAGGPRPHPPEVRLLEMPRRRGQPTGPAQAHTRRHGRAGAGRLRGRQQVRRSPAAVSTRRYLDATWCV